MKGKLAPPPFDGYRVYDPIMNNEGRRSVTLVNIEGPHRTTLAYAKYLMSIEVGRWLERDEHVHHINGDCSDDRIENFEIVSRLEHVNRHPGKGPKREPGFVNIVDVNLLDVMMENIKVFVQESILTLI